MKVQWQVKGRDIIRKIGRVQHAEGLLLLASAHLRKKPA